MSNPPFVCKNCGSEKFKVPVLPKTMSDIDGIATCTKCGTKMTKKEIEVQARKIAVDAIKKAGFKVK